MGKRALSDLKVVEYADFISGPYCAKLMADLGAEVIKVEEPGVGDKARRSGPFLDDIPHPERSGLFLYLNTNKLGVTLNLRTPAGVKIFKELIKEADILVENNPPSVMKELGLTYHTLKEINPRLIMTSITPFGQSGPYRDYKASDLVSIHMGGIGYVTPWMVNDPEKEPPLKGGGRQADFLAGVSAALVTMAAVYARQWSGLGQHIDLSEHEAVACILGRDIAAYSLEKVLWDRTKAPVAGAVSLLPCKDGYIQLHPREDRQWLQFVEIMGNPEWAKDERFKTAESRSNNWNSLVPLIWEWTKERTKEEIYHACQAKRIACGPVNSMDEVFRSPQLEAREFFVEINHPETGKLRFPRGPYKFSETPWRLARPAPLLGEHNEEVFSKRLGHSSEELVRMREAGII